MHFVCDEAETDRDHMDVVGVWSGRHASALRTALRLTNEAFAEQLGTAVRTVAKWNADPELVPNTELQRALDTMLQRSGADVRARFASLVEERTPIPLPRQPAGDAGTRRDDSAAALRLSHDPSIGQALSWLDQAANWPSGEARRRVQQNLQDLDAAKLAATAQHRSAVGREAVADALIRHYGEADPYVPYRVACDGQPIRTSVLTRPDWLDLNLGLAEGCDHLQLRSSVAAPRTAVDEYAANAAAQRLAEALGGDIRITNSPLYRLLDVDATPEGLAGALGLTDFVAYAMTLDLLENELIDQLVKNPAPSPDALPLRQRYLPDLNSVTSVADRLCAGGPLALFAAARTGSRGRPGEPDYVLLVQERSGRVLNAARRLAVIPKAFHQPLVDFSDDAQLSSTLERELEEELFGRAELDSTNPDHRQADPLHISRLSPPMRWLIDRADTPTWQMECTGLGFNLVSGTFEFASLVVIHDDEWWTRFGGSIEANWETGGLRRFSSLDREGIGRLVHDASWSNEGLFAFLQGQRRLTAIGEHRVNLPTIDLEM
jgi:DNA-binding transcriptional regulator YiaG